MAGFATLAFSFAVIFLLVASVYGAVERNERVVFCVSVLLIIAGSSIGAMTLLSPSISGVISAIGVLGIFGSTLPLFY